MKEVPCYKIENIKHSNKKRNLGSVKLPLAGRLWAHCLWQRPPNAPLAGGQRAQGSEQTLQNSEQNSDM